MGKSLVSCFFDSRCSSAVQVCPNSKASEAGISAGDVVLAINGVSTHALTDAELSRLVNSAQQRLALQLAPAR